MFNRFNLIFLTLFKIGNIKYAPGTIASLFTCSVFLVLISIFNIPTIILITTLIFFYSFVAINSSYNEFNSKDPQEIVIDEFVGQILPLIAIPIYETLYPLPKVYYVIAAFILFRFFDIIKPFPINYVDDNTKNTLGIMLDDIIAGFFTVIILTIICFFFGG